MAALALRLAYDPTVLLEAAAEGFLRPAPVRAAGGGAREPFPTPPYLLALRQGGLRDDLLDLAARQGAPGWFDPPLCTFQELPGRLGAGEAQPLGAFERAALIAAVVRRVDGDVLARLRRPEAYLSALDRFVGELAAEGVTPDALEVAHARCADRDEFAVKRDREVAAVYRQYLAELVREGRRDGRDSLAACAVAVRADPDALARALGGRRAIRLVGLQDLRGGWRALLSALRDSPALDEVAVYTSVALDLEPLGAVVERLPEPDCLARGLFEADPAGDVATSAIAASAAAPAAEGAPSKSRPRKRSAIDFLQQSLFDELPPEVLAPPPLRGSVRVIVAPDAQREVEEVAARVRTLVDAGAAPHRIAVVAREARPQLPMAAAALRRLALPVTARERTGLGEVPVVRAVLALLDVAAGGWTRHGLVELADQPYLGVELDAGVVDTVGFRTPLAGLAAWDEALERLLAEALEREKKEAAGEPDENGHRRPVPPSWRVERTQRQLKALRERVDALGEPRPLKDWLAWLRTLLEEDAWGLERRVYQAPSERTDIIRLDLAGLKAVGTIAAEWSDALERWGDGTEPLDVGAFAARLREELDADVALWTGTRRGVQVLEGLAAAYRGFEHVFVVGMEAGRFPRAPGRSPLLDTVEREALIEARLPLDGRAAWEQRERELFRSVVAGARSLTVSHARLDAAGREVAPSSFVEALGDVADLNPDEIPVARVVTPGLPLCAPERLADAEAAARSERRRQAGVACVENGSIEDPALIAWLAERFGDERVWSPTQLESFAKCPWAYFSGRVLRLEKREDPDTEMDPAVRGGILHDALHRFYDAAVLHRGGEPVLLREEDRGWAEPVLEASLDRALAAAGDEEWLGLPALRRARREDLRRLLRRYLEFEIEHADDLHNPRTNAGGTLRTGVAEHEKAIDGIVLERDGVRFRFRGFIDRVEVGIDERLAGDPKRYVAAVDYKSSKASTPGAGKAAAWKDGVVLQVPLYAYALSRMGEGAQVARVEYRSLRPPDIVHSLELVTIDKKSGELVQQPDAAAKLDAALDAAAAYVRDMREGRFPVKPASSCGCPPWCHGRDICRVPGGPKESPR